MGPGRPRCAPPGEGDEVAEHHRREQALDPGLTLGLDLDHGRGGGLDQLGGQLGALALAGMLICVGEDYRREAIPVPVRGPADDLVVVELWS